MKNTINKLVNKIKKVQLNWYSITFESNGLTKYSTVQASSNKKAINQVKENNGYDIKIVKVNKG